MAVDAGPVRLSVDHLNEVPAPAFVEAMAPFFEGTLGFLLRLAAARPFRDERDLFERAATMALAMPEEDQIELIDAHPRIGAPPRSMSAASFVEQGHDRQPDSEAEAETVAAHARRGIQADLDRLNARYEARFGFHFVVFVAGRPLSQIVPLMEARLGADRGAELRIALADVVAIARDRWRKAG